MSKKKNKKAPKTGSVWHMTSEEATLANKPIYNGFAGGYGAHGDTKYNRNKEKDALRRQISDESE